MGQFTCEEHGGVFVYNAISMIPCPICEEIEELKDEIDTLKQEAEVRLKET